MAGFKQAWENNVLNAVFRNTSFSSPATVYVGLYTSAPSDTAEGTEVSGGGYARQAVTFSAPSGNPATISNSSSVTFPVATANWGTVTHAAIHSASSGAGNQIAWGPLTTAKQINTDDQAVFNAGALSVTLD